MINRIRFGVERVIYEYIVVLVSQNLKDLKNYFDITRYPIYVCIFYCF